MTAEQSLVGAMGCASWRVHRRLREYAQVAPVGRALHGGKVNPLSVHHAAADGLNEVGVTDWAMVTLWRFGPKAVAFGISSGAEHHHLGADIAIVHRATHRVLLFQAKLARTIDDGKTLNLKSPVTDDQVALLGQPTVELEGNSFQVTGRLALYQSDVTQFLDRCDVWPVWDQRWWRHADDFDVDPIVGRRYYERLLSRGCSPSGILAARVDAPDYLDRVAVDRTWPWEFDTFEWFDETSPLDPPSGSPRFAPALGQRVPAFTDYQALGGDPEEASLAMARALAQQLNLASTTQLYVCVV